MLLAAIVVCWAALVLFSSIAEATAGSISSGPAKALVGSKQWSFAFKDKRKEPVLEERGGIGSGPVGRLGFNLNGSWKHATRVKRSRTVNGGARLLRVAIEAGCYPVDGIGMALYQALPAFERWYGERPMVDDGARAAVVAAFAE